MIKLNEKLKRNASIVAIFLTIAVIARMALKILVHKIDSSGQTAYWLFYACTIAPLCEELVFRVAPLKFISAVAPKLLWTAVLMSSIIFGLVHGYGWHNVLNQGVTGFFFAVIYIRTNYNYWAAVAAHSIWNFMAFLVYGL